MRELGRGRASDERWQWEQDAGVTEHMGVGVEQSWRCLEGYGREVPGEDHAFGAYFGPGGGMS